MEGEAEKIGGTSEVTGETGEKVEMLEEKVGSRHETGEPGGLVNEVSEAGEVIDEVGEVLEFAIELVGDMSETNEAADSQSEGIAAVHTAVMEPRVPESLLESASVCVFTPASMKQCIKCKNVMTAVVEGFKPGRLKTPLQTATVMQKHRVVTCLISPLLVKKVNTSQKMFKLFIHPSSAYGWVAGAAV